MVFENNEEGKGASYDLLFAPNPVWSQGENWVINLDPHDPNLKPGSVLKLLEQEKIKHVKKCIIIVHENGLGSADCLEIIKKDLENVNILYKVISFRELK